MTVPQWLSNRLGKLIPARGTDTAPSDAKAQTTLARGHRAETTAAEYLSRQGLKLIDRNVRAGRGEIDLIMQDGSTLVFVEVRARKAGAWVSAAESVSFGKRKKIIETAERLLNEKPAWRKCPCRFDVVAIGLPSESSSEPDSRQTEVNWIQDAFQAE
jgi:putative endonuclease